MHRIWRLDLSLLVYVLGAQSDSLAPGAAALISNAPLEAAFAASPLWDELAANPSVTSGSGDVNLAFNNAGVDAALKQQPKSAPPC